MSPAAIGSNLTNSKSRKHICNHKLESNTLDTGHANANLFPFRFSSQASTFTFTFVFFLVQKRRASILLTTSSMSTDGSSSISASEGGTEVESVSAFNANSSR